MNATATAPVVVFDLKNANAQDLVAHLSGLQEKAADHTIPDADLTKIEKDIAATYGAIRSLKKNRTTELDAIKTKLTTYSFSIKELFGDDALNQFGDHEITTEAQHRGLFSPKTAKTPKVDGESKPRAASVPKVFASDSNALFISIPKNPEESSVVKNIAIKQGRVNEPYNGKSGPAFATIGKPALRLKGKDIAETEKNLSKFIAPESKEFAKTSEGKAELTKYATLVFNYVEPKAKAA